MAVSGGRGSWGGRALHINLLGLQRETSTNGITGYSADHTKRNRLLASGMVSLRGSRRTTSMHDIIHARIPSIIFARFLLSFSLPRRNLDLGSHFGGSLCKIRTVLAHVTAWGPHDLRNLAHFFRVGPVFFIYRSRTRYPTGRYKIYCR